jgi:hypothetical protein
MIVYYVMSGQAWLETAVDRCIERPSQRVHVVWRRGMGGRCSSARRESFMPAIPPAAARKSNGPERAIPIIEAALWLAVIVFDGTASGARMANLPGIRLRGGDLCVNDLVARLAFVSFC